METVKIPQFAEMGKDYQDDVNSKLSDLKPVSEEIYQDLRQMFSDGYVLSTTFRMKDRQRIVEKDVLDYVGDESFDTQVKDLYAARLCPSRRHATLSEKKVKDLMQLTIKRFYRYNPRIKVTVENKTLKNGMNVRYIVFNGHIELQILTLNQYLVLEDDHDKYVELRNPAAMATPDIKVIYSNHVIVVTGLSGSGCSLDGSILNDVSTNDVEY